MKTFPSGFPYKGDNFLVIYFYQTDENICKTKCKYTMLRQIITKKEIYTTYINICIHSTMKTYIGISF